MHYYRIERQKGSFLNKIRSKLARTLGYVVGFYPVPLPKIGTEFKPFCDRVFRLYDLPNEPSYYEAVGTAILHLKPPHRHRATPHFFAQVVMRTMANHTAFNMIRAIKADEQKTQKLAEAPALAGSIEGIPKQGI